MAKKTSLKILSVGGSIIIPKIGFDITFLKKFRKLILDEVTRGTKFILVIGGGTTARLYQSGLRNMGEKDNTVLDWMGIQTTMVNAEFVKYIFGNHAHHTVILDPTKKVALKKSICIAAGWKPGCSTDNDAVLLAKTFGADEIINCSNISYVYDKDPNKFDDAKKIEAIDWETFRRDIVGDIWEPGKNVPFDPTAARTAEKLHLTVKMVDGMNLKELKKALRGEKFRGTVIM